MDLAKYYAHIIERYPEYVTQNQMCEICGISKKTAFAWEHSGKIPYTVEINRLIHTHKIKLTDILAYLYEKECCQEADSDYILTMRKFYEMQFADYPDVLSSKTIESMTGFSSTAIGDWLKSGKLKSKMVKQHYKIPKAYLIDFIVSPYYRQIKNKSKKQKSDMAAFEEWYKTECSGCDSI